MKKIPFICLICLMVLTGCSGKSEKREKVEEQINALFTELKNDNDSNLIVKGYDNLKLEFSTRSDSIMLYSATIKTESDNGIESGIPIEFIYFEFPDDNGEVLSVNFVSKNGSLIDTNDEIIENVGKNISKGEFEKIKDVKDEILTMTIMAYLLSPNAKVKHITTK